MMTRICGCILATLLVGCALDADERMAPPPLPNFSTTTECDNALNVDASRPYVGCDASVAERIATLSLRTPDAPGPSVLVLNLCRAPANQRLPQLPSAGQSGDDPVTGAGFNAVATVVAASDQSVSVEFDATWTGGDQPDVLARGLLETRLGSAKQHTAPSGVLVVLRYHYGRQRSN